MVTPTRLRTLKVDIPGICLFVSPSKYVLNSLLLLIYMNESQLWNEVKMHSYPHIMYTHIPVHCDGKKHVHVHLSHSKTVLSILFILHMITGES